MRLPKLANIEILKDIAKRVLDILKTKVSRNSDGVTLPLLMTRVDMGVMREGEFNPWVNEVEYVPSYYVEDHTHPLEGTVAKQCVVIAKKFLGIDSISDLDKYPQCVETPSKNHITPDVRDDDPTLACSVAASNGLNNSLQMDNPIIFADLPASPILNVIPTTEHAEPDADMCMDISFVDT